jgi:uncharacterized membrane protein YagU involved in acid resistance
MHTSTAGAIAGVIGGAVMAGAMSAGRRTGVMAPSLAELAEDWLDRRFGTRRKIGEAGTSVLEQLNHVAASGVFGIVYARGRRHFRSLAPLAAGALFGTGLYALNIGGIAPLIGLTHGEWKVPPQTALQRLGTHILFGVVTAVIADSLIGDQG